jgi:hypothetical protein
VSIAWDSTPGYTALFQDVTFLNCSVVGHVVGSGLAAVYLVGGAVCVLADSPQVQVNFESCVATGNSVTGTGSLPLGAYVMTNGGAVSVVVNGTASNGTAMSAAVSSSILFTDFLGTDNTVAWDSAMEGATQSNAATGVFLGWAKGGVVVCVCMCMCVCGVCVCVCAVCVVYVYVCMCVCGCLVHAPRVSAIPK